MTDLRRTPLRRLLLLSALMGGASLVEDTATGNPVVFSTEVAKPLVSLEIPFTPIQSGTGDPSPQNIRPITGWTGLKVEHFDENLLSINRTSGQTTQGITFTPIKQDNKTVAVKVEGTRSNTNPFFNLNYVNGTTVSISPGTYKIFGAVPGVRFQVFYIDAGGAEKTAGTDTGEGATVTIPNDALASWCRLHVNVDTYVNAVVYPIIMSADSPITKNDIIFPAQGKNLLDPSTLEQGSINADGAAVSNPKRIKTGFIPVKENTYYVISAGAEYKLFMHYYDKDKVSIGNNTIAKSKSPVGACYVRGIIGFQEETNIVPSDCTTGQIEETTQSGTATAYEPFKPVYGGEHEAVSGMLSSEWEEIASYNGETLPGEWLSDRDVYQAGTTPTIGAQVVYKLATPQEQTLTGHQITALVGDNTIWSDADGSMTAVYLKKA